jgi:hypothetical protein
VNFYLQLAVHAPPPPLEISESEFIGLQHARKVLNAAFSFEENYDLLIGNYLEIENSALGLTASIMARRLHGYEEMFELTAEVNRRAVNFLSTARLFVDQILQRISDCDGDREAVRHLLRQEYAEAFEYRFMEALRNHVQHSGSAVHGLSFGGDWAPPGTRDRRVFVLSASSHKRYLELDPKFKKTVLQECPDQVDFMQAMRRYLSALSNIHDFARSSTKESVEKARKTFEDAISRYQSFSNESSLGLTAYGSRPTGKMDQVLVFLKWDDVRIKLSKRNHKLRYLDRTIISNSNV